EAAFDAAGEFHAAPEFRWVDGREDFIGPFARASRVGRDDLKVIGRVRAQATQVCRYRYGVGGGTRQRRTGNARFVGGRGAVVEVAVAHKPPLGVDGGVERGAG